MHILDQPLTILYIPYPTAPPLQLHATAETAADVAAAAAVLFELITLTIVQTYSFIYL